MDEPFHKIGDASNITSSDSFDLATAKQLFEVCLSNSSFEVIEKQTEKEADEIIAESIIVDCLCSGVGTRNKVGIKNRERLAIRCSSNIKNPYAVYALRKSFPPTLHQTFIKHDYPVSLCIYLEPWSVTERTWTPQQYLQRIIAWLEGTAQNTLHKQDQPVEHIFFSSPYHVFVPKDFHQRTQENQNSFKLVRVNDDERKIILRACFAEQVQQVKEFPSIDALAITLQPATHGRIKLPPRSLGELNSDLGCRGSQFIEYVEQALALKLGSTPFRPDDKDKRTLLVCSIPVCRNEGEEPENYETHGYMVMGGIKSLAVTLNLATLVDGWAYPNSLLLGSQKNTISSDSWGSILILPIEISKEYGTEDAKNASGIPSSGSEFLGVLGGVGALGSALADIWSREGWGDWLYIDDDIVEPHNIVRHIAKNEHIGQQKAAVVDESSFFNFHAQNRFPIYDKINSFENKDVVDALSISQLIIDATTTLDAPRDLASLEGIGRCCSVFLTPCGYDSVLIIEDIEREKRLNILEMQYYRGIIRNKWGESHLKGNHGHFWTGAGCRSVSSVMPYDLIKMHSGLLARQVRMQSSQPSEHIKIFQHKDTGEISVHQILSPPACTKKLGGWNVIYDNDIISAVNSLRDSSLPKETGGVLVGYIDHKARCIYVVDALSAPPDSVMDKTGFERGYIGLQEELTDIKQKTASIVGYIGEWHSHPPKCSPRPSTQDLNLLIFLKEKMTSDGLPIIMLIVGDDDGITLCLGDN